MSNASAASEAAGTPHAYQKAKPLETHGYIGVAATLLFFDHSITFVEELDFIWFNKAAGLGNRLGFLVNRYLTEAMVLYVSYMLSGDSKGLTDRVSCQIFLWLFAIASTVFVAVSHFIIMARLYTLWDRRPRIKWILMAAFSVAISISMTFSILSAHQVQPFLKYNLILHMCTFAKKPWALPFMLGALTSFDLFIIVATVINALDRPHQKQADVMTALQRDGALMFTVNLMMAVFGNPSNCFVTLSFVWAMCSMVNSRLQLRVEGLRFIRFVPTLDDPLELYNISNAV
ncbi:hypothetical protein B0H15DRAFT_815862 [Mycena belliarum]|uniref:DUF6533 domain-containing protein n=1 Tax=Mycena belliarum TaxID=1033014 RepID=A0AAD6UHE8_9AGAR|nr:hypothetical protein B0H15DRAFT_815862 [Mycena belliae]